MAPASDDDIDILIQDVLSGSSHGKPSSLGALARNLYPRQRVARDVVLRAVAGLGHGALKPSLALQAALLRWLAMVFDVLEDRAVLGRAYPVLFNLLDTAAIRPQLAQLLALVTRRRHVRPFRIQTLLALSRQTGNDPSLVGLLRVYKDYYPEIIVGEAVRGKASAFKHPDPQWRARLDEIQEAHARQAEETPSGRRDGFRVYRPLNRALGNKVIPTVRTGQATEDSVTLEEVDNVVSFVQNLEKLELPNQLVAVLADPLLQKLAALRPGAESQRRIANWLGSVLREVLDGDADEETLWEVLEVVRDFVLQTTTLPTALLEFFSLFLETWNGVGRRDLVFDILGYAPLYDFEELYKHIFQPLEAAVQDESPSSLLTLMAMYTNVLRHWTTVLLGADSIPPQASQIASSLVRHVSRLALVAIQADGSIGAESAVLTFYEQTMRLVADDGLRQYMRIELPPSALVYALLFSPSLATVSRLCSVLACYKRGFETAVSTKARHDGSARVDALSYDRAYVNRYNGFLMDMCNCFWRARAFSDTDTNARGCMVPRPTVSALEAYVASLDRTVSLANLFSLSHAPVLCLQSIRRVRDAEEAAIERAAQGGKGDAIRTRHAGPVTQSSLAKLAAAGGIRLTWQEYRIDVLRSLSDMGLPGVTELLKNTMTVLKNSMEGKTGSQASVATPGSSQRTPSQSQASQRSR
ncbi:hypothetical protein HIM_00424 [Hirsutella minnesotensis 3608]|nr:hypothetical protein HIM_00424 [Hirsutella minnesotensis 3608]